MQKKLMITYYNIKGQRVLLRVDFNVPLNSKGVITNDKKIRESLQTIQYMMQEGAKIIICSHLGRPEGKVVPEFSLKPCAERLAKLLKTPVLLSTDVGGVDTHKLVRGMKDGDIVMMENLRFDPGEEQNSEVISCIVEISVILTILIISGAETSKSPHFQSPASQLEVSG